MPTPQIKRVDKSKAACIRRLIMSGLSANMEETHLALVFATKNSCDTFNFYL